jgi:hypothetical protein
VAIGIAIPALVVVVIVVLSRSSMIALPLDVVLLLVGETPHCVEV